MKSIARILSIFALTLCTALAADTTNRWVIDQDGGITWNVKPHDVHNDNVEMSGKKVSVIVTYGTDEAGDFFTRKLLVFPTFRTVPANTRSHISHDFTNRELPRIVLNHATVPSVTTRVHFKGILTANGSLGTNNEIAWQRTVFPSTDKPLVVEEYTFSNRANHEATIGLENTEAAVNTNPTNGLDGAAYIMSSHLLGAAEKKLKPGESVSMSIAYTARRIEDAPLAVDVAAEKQARAALIESYFSELQLETPNPVLNTAFAFAKIRAAESIYLTKGGLMHGPGGGRYYAAIWANDQAEYANPFFAFLGDRTATESATNAYRMFAQYMNPDYKAIPSSIVAEGTETWHGAGDRGDMAMIAYGSSRFALARGDRATAEQLWPLVQWCLEYCKRHVNADGVVTSDADELENRFPSGKANLCTSSLYYDALLSGAMLARELGKPAAVAEDYETRAKALRTALNNYFGRNVEGFETYRYFDKAVPSVNAKALARHKHYENEPDHLRAWICVPLTVGIYDRAPGTIDALFSPKLWTADGLATEAGKVVFWDRSTLYALRGIFAAGDTERALEHLAYYSNRRLLGEHVPYAVEAYPEGNQAHLSAESALYCRIYTEGLFGIRPTGLRSFNCTPRLPKEWPAMALKKIQAFGGGVDVNVSRADGKLNVRVTKDGKTVANSTIADGDSLAVNLPK
jgi:hypothetical protein